jgi:MFS family permease
MHKIINNFRTIDKPILYLIGAVFFSQLIEAGLFILLNYYLKNLQYSDTAIAELTAFRYMAIMVLALPLGIFIKGRKLKPFFFFSAIATPLLTLVALYALENHQTNLAEVAMLFWGFTRICLGVTTLPFIVNNTPEDKHSEAITLYFMTSSLTIFLMGLLYAGLHALNPQWFDEGRVLQLVCFLGLLSVYFVHKIQLEEKTGQRADWRALSASFDWGIIAKVSMPTFLIAIGAGLTIPFVNLFFQQVHHIASAEFSLIGSFSFVLVSVMLIFIPSIQRRFGFRVAITLFQSLAVLALFVMATTEYYAHLPFAAEIAIAAYLLRQPLMNVAGPSTSELSLHFVGERNREMISAINAAIWSGSWFVSSLVFGYLRSKAVPYAHIFFMTVLLYILAILWYVYLIKLHKKLNLDKPEDEGLQYEVN